MAKFENKLVTKVVEKIVKEEVRERQNILYLNDAELKTLYIILMNVGGNGENSPRKHAQNILDEISYQCKSLTDKNGEYRSLKRFFDGKDQTLFFKENSLSELE